MGTPNVPDEKKKKKKESRFSTVPDENPFANARSNSTFFADRIRRPRPSAACKNCGASDHTFKSCMERPKSISPFKEAPAASLPLKKVKTTVPEKEKRTVSLKTERTYGWNYTSRDESLVQSGKIQNQQTGWGHNQSQNKLVSQEQEKGQVGLGGSIRFTKELKGEPHMGDSAPPPPKRGGQRPRPNSGGPPRPQNNMGRQRPLANYRRVPPRNYGGAPAHNNRGGAPAQNNIGRAPPSALDNLRGALAQNNIGGAPPQNNIGGAPAQNNRGGGCPQDAGCSGNYNSDQQQSGGTQQPQHQNKHSPKRDSSWTPYQG